MDMGDSDSGSDNDGGGFGVGVLFDVGGGWAGFIVLIGILCLVLYCNAQEEAKNAARAAQDTAQKKSFCTDVCAQYDNVPVIQGSQCYCRDEQGIYDPSTPRTPSSALPEKAK